MFLTSDRIVLIFIYQNVDISFFGTFLLTLLNYPQLSFAVTMRNFLCIYHVNEKKNYIIQALHTTLLSTVTACVVHRRFTVITFYSEPQPTFVYGGY